MSPHIFPIDGSLATSMRLLSENRLTHCSTSNIRTHRWDPAPRCLLFSCFLEGLVWLLGPNDIQGSPEHFQTLRSPSRLSGEWAHHFQGWVRQSECPTDVRELQTHFKQGCSDSHCTTPPADFNRCPTSFKRDHSNTVQLQWLLHCFSICFFIKVLPLPCGHHSLLPTC